LIFSIFNQLFIYFIRILPIFGGEAEEETKLIKELLSDTKRFSNNTSATYTNTSIKSSTYTESINTTKTNDSKIKRLSQMVISYHNQKSISQE